MGFPQNAENMEGLSKRATFSRRIGHQAGRPLEYQEQKVQSMRTNVAFIRKNLQRWSSQLFQVVGNILEASLFHIYPSRSGNEYALSVQRASEVKSIFPKGRWLQILGIILLASMGCRKEEIKEETTCYSPDLTNPLSISLGEGVSYPISVFDGKDELIVVMRDKIVFMMKASDGVSYELPLKGIMGVEANGPDTILHTYSKIFRLKSSDRSVELIADTGIGDIYNFSILPSVGITYIKRDNSGKSLQYLDFDTGLSSKILSLDDSIPALQYPFGQMRSYMKDGRPHLLLAFNERNNTIRTMGHVLEIDLEKKLISQRHFLKEMSDLTVLDFNDNKKIFFSGDPVGGIPGTGVFTLDVGTGHMELNYAFEDDYWTKTKFQQPPCLVRITMDEKKTYRAYLINYKTGETLVSLIAPKTYYEVNPVMGNIGTESMIYAWYSKALVVGNDNCVRYSLNEFNKFERILATTPEYVIALLENGSVKMFPLN